MALNHKKSIAYMALKKQRAEARFRLAKFITVSTRRTEYAIHEDDMQGR